MRRLFLLALTLLATNLITACGDVEPSHHLSVRRSVTTEHDETVRLVDLAASAHDRRAQFYGDVLARAWLSTVAKNAEAARNRVLLAERAVNTPAHGVASAPSVGSVNGYPCGGTLPSCCILQRESGGNPTIVEPGGRGNPYTNASGLWQFMPGTWNNFGGYPYAAAAPADVQNAKAAEVWASDPGAWTRYDGC